MKAYSIKKASEMLGVHWRTIKNWIYTNKINSFKTPNGYHRIPDHEIKRIINTNDDKPVILYSRVSSHQQKDDLARQQQRLREYAISLNKQYTELSDIGSGLNDKRKKLKTALELIRNNKSHEIIIEHRDRLTRFGYEYISFLVESFNGTITIINDTEQKEDLVRDLTEIMVSFCARIYGRRSNKTKAKTLIEKMND